jgi:hypothetical protein
MATDTKLEIATLQLRSAVTLFCSARDRFSAITLAGAADVILSQLLLDAGKENFSDHIMRADNAVDGIVRDRGKHGREVNDMLMINALKHMDSTDADSIELNVRICAAATVAKAVANYVSLVSDEADFVQVFKHWAAVFTPKGLDENGDPIQ